MNVLFIGGTGLISTEVSRLALAKGINLTLLNRGNHKDALPRGVKTITADIKDEDDVKTLIATLTFDVVVDWVAFTEADVMRDYRLFKGKTTQYIFISSASAYQKPLPTVPITERIPLGNPFWQYSQHKKRCEDTLRNLRDPAFHVTIIRPAHTYNERSIVFQVQPWDHPFTLIRRILDKRPIVIPDDGKTRWTLTHNRDFAKGFLDLLGNEAAYDDTFHLTSDKVYTWNDLAMSVYAALDEKPNVIHMPSDIILRHFPELKGPMLGDNLHHSVYDNSKIKAIAPHYASTIDYTNVVARAVKHYLDNPDNQTVNHSFLARYDRMVEAYLARK